MTNNRYILKVEGIHKSYRMGATEVKVLRGVDLAIEKGEFVAIIGSSGSGKSTLLHIMGTLDRPDKGTVWLCSKPIAQLTSVVNTTATRIPGIFGI